MYYSYSDRGSWNAERHNHGRKGRFHEMVCNARDRRLPRKLAWAAAAVVAICMAVWNYATIGSLQIVPITILFLIYHLLFRVASALVFFILDVITRSTYDSSYAYEDYTDQSERYSSYSDTAYQEKDNAYETALKMFNLSERFSMEDLKKARNRMITNEKLHPDDGGDPEKFKELMRAYTLLSEYAE